MDVLTTKMLVFVAVFLLVMSISGLVRSRGVAREKSAARRQAPLLFRLFSRQIFTLGNATLAMQEALAPRWASRVRADLRAAGLDGYITLQDVAGAQAFVGLAVGGASLLLLFLGGATPGWLLFVTLFLAAVGWVYPVVWIQKKALERRQIISRDLPYALDLATTAVEAGQDFGAALRYMTRECLTGPLADEFNTMLREMDLGKSRQEALRQLADRVGTNDLARLSSALIQSMETGASLGTTLRMQAEDMRRERFNRAERQAARAPSLMIIPMLLFIVPGIFLIVLTPAILRMLVATGRMTP